MKFTLVKDDGLVGVDGEFREVPLGALDPNIRAVQWDGDKGHVEFYVGANTVLENLESFSSVIQAWYNLTPKPEPEPTLDDLKTLKKISINQSRDSEETGGFEYLGKVLDSDERSTLRITMAAMTARLALDVGQPFSIDWVTKDNSVLTLDVYQTLEMPKALAVHGLTVHGKAKYLKGKADNATSPEDLDRIVW